MSVVGAGKVHDEIPEAGRRSPGDDVAKQLRRLDRKRRIWRIRRPCLARSARKRT